MKTKAEDFPEIPNHRRHNYFAIIDGHFPIHPIAHRLHYLDSHFPKDRIDKALGWLVVNRFVGLEFIAWFKNVCDNSDLEMHRQLLQITNREDAVRVIAGKNFRI